MADIGRAAPRPSRSGDEPTPTGSILEPLSFSAIVGWREDNHAAAFKTFLSGAERISKTRPTTRPLGGDAAALQRIAIAALGQQHLSAEAARQFLEAHFAPSRIRANGFVTGYYEPEASASLTRTATFAVPLYRRPDDLVEVSSSNRPDGWNPEMRFGRQSAAGITPFFDRSAIENGALQERGLELAWLESAVTAFFIHVQGSAQLRLTDGSTMRVAFDGKTGHPYTSIGRLAVQRGILSREEAHKDGLEAWLNTHPEEGRALMRENRSFIFFRRTDQAEEEGPFGAAGVSLTAGRSLAVDRTLVTFHTPVWVEVAGLSDPDRPKQRFQRLMVAQDTGSAIVGPGRGDIFFGSGDAAGSLAGNVRHPAEMILLLPKSYNPQ
jgi:membrane-bound lytic murein transglycosylase A